MWSAPVKPQGLMQMSALEPGLISRKSCKDCNDHGSLETCRAALATEDPAPQLLLNKPHGRNEPLINRLMWKHIFLQGVYQLFWLFLIFYGASTVINGFVLPSTCESFQVIDSHYVSNVSLVNPGASVTPDLPSPLLHLYAWLKAIPAVRISQSEASNDVQYCFGCGIA